MPLYFAYGANMDVAAMTQRCPRARLVGRGRLPRWRPLLMSSGFLSIEPDPRTSVHGLLWDASPPDVIALDRFEDVAHGLYVKRILPILREPVGSARALVYVGANQESGMAWSGYLGEVVAAARAQQLPARYVAYLEQLGREGGPRQAGVAAANRRGP